MSAPCPKLELFILPGALYTRRVLIYLFEKGVLTSNSTSGSKEGKLESKIMKITKVRSTLSGKMIADGKPEGSVPLLVVRYEDGDGEGEGEGDGGGGRNGKGEDKVVIGSLEIISYFETLFSFPTQSHDPPTPTPASIPSDEQLQLLARRTMSGQTPDQKAKIKELNILLDEATTSFENAARKGSAMFAFLEKRDREASRGSLEKCREVLGTINESYVNNPHFTASTTEQEGGVGKGKVELNISDIILFTLLQFAHIMYDIQLWDGFAGLEHFYKWFEKRESVLVEGTEGEVWDRNLRLVASCWVGNGGAVWEWGRVVGVLLRAVGGVVWGLLL
jgi:hypothetical protein